MSSHSPRAKLSNFRRSNVQPHVLLTLLLVNVLFHLPSSASYPFRDVSTAVGLVRNLGKRQKYGGAAIADLNGDGYPDLLFGHHDNRSIQLYYNNRNGTFTLSSFMQWRDTHALTPIRLSPGDKYMYFLLSRGGNYGKDPSPPHVFRTTANIHDAVEETERSPDLSFGKGRGRTVIFMSLRANRQRDGIMRPDVLVLNARALNKKINHFAFEVGLNNTFRKMPLNAEFGELPNSYSTVTDIDGDGQMEVVILHTLSIWKLTRDFTLTNISANVLPGPVSQFMSVSALAELDYDNDGDWDLFMTRSATMDLRWSKHIYPRHDILLRNDGGKFKDMSIKAHIPRSGNATESRGVTVGDFDNDGWVDIFIVRYDHNPSMILLRNQGDGTFHKVRHGLGERPPNVAGDMATAVDYDLDGRLDIVLSEGDWFNQAYGGYYRVIRNIFSNGNSFLLVRVKNSPGSRSTTSLHAVVTATLADGSKMMRRVGTPSASVSLSYIETVHFGLGKRLFVVTVSVRWVNGVVRTMPRVRANSTVTFGV